jgi:hypothetical protein
MRRHGRQSRDDFAASSKREVARRLRPRLFRAHVEVGGELQGAIESGHGFLEPAEGAQGIAAVGVRQDEVGPELERPVVIGEGLGRAIEGLQRVAAVVERVRHIGPELQGPVVTGERLLGPFQVEQGEAEIGMGLGRGRIDGQRPVDPLRRRSWLAELIVVEEGG